MKALLINHTNHPYARWSEPQKLHTTEIYKEVIDMPFPNVDPRMSINDIRLKVIDQLDHLNLSYTNYDILITGEMTYVYQYVTEASARRIRCICATTKRHTQTMDDGSILRTFTFIKYRDYESI